MSERQASPGVLLLHGFTGSAASWDEIVTRLERADVRAAAIDIPGHGARAGEVDPVRFRLDAVIDAVGAALDGLRTASAPVVLAGYSMGGRLALHCAFALSGRIDGLVLESSSPGLQTAVQRAERRDADEALARRLEAEGIEPFVDAWEALPLFASQRRLDPEVRARVRRGRLANDPRSLAAALRGLGTGALPSLWDRLGRVSIPVHLVVGAEDEKFVDIGRRMADALPTCTLEEVRGAGHAVHVERPDRWAASVAAFARGVGDGS